MAISTKYKVKKGSPESLLSVAKLSEKDLPLIQRLELNTAFTPSGNRLDVFFYALDGRFLSSTIDSKNYSVVRGGSKEDDTIEDITLNPQKDSIDAGYVNGDVNVLYNFVNNLLSERNAQPKLFIESISSDRTEIRALTNDVSTKRLAGFIDNAKARLDDSKYFEDFRLNFGKNILPIVINLGRVAFKDTQAVILKLYEPLPSSIEVKDTFLLEELVGDSVLYQVETEVSSTEESISNLLRGPNYDIELVEENNNPTGFLNYDELFSYPVTNSYYEVYSLFNEKGAQISIDHTNFSEFIHFSSAEERLRNFYYKASLLESYRNQVNARNSYTGSIDEQITGIINNFDHYDRYLYFETGSTAWPKSSSTRPYALFSTGSSEVSTWYTEQINSASLFDLQNGNRLINTIPSFIREDDNNAPYSLFVDMVGQHFDNLWIYSKAVSDKYNADNRLDFGISKDLVRDAIENFGISLYNNNEALNNLFSAFTGETYDSGSEVISSLITAVEGSGSLTGSVGNTHLQPVPKSSYQKEIYKRIYHNLPLLSKSKGTERGLRALINSFGIPSDILKIKTFGGADTSTTLFYGPNAEVTSSLGKIKISNTDIVVTGSTLSNSTSVVNYGKDFSKDLHTVEIGFSPADSLDQYIISHPSMSAFNLDTYIGDPDLAYSSSYYSLDRLADTVFTSGSAYTNVYNAVDFVRLIKFFDNSIFRIVKDFLPARSNVDTGIVIKPHLLNRSKIKQPEVKWSNQSSPNFQHSATKLDYTGSYYSSNFSLEGNIETAFITGSSGLDSRYTSSYYKTYPNPYGGFQILSSSRHDEASYTGEFSGSILEVSSGDLTVGNTFRKLEPAEFSFKYLPRNDFNIDSSNVESTGYPLGIVDTSSTGSSPAQTESGTAIELSIENLDDTTVDFRILGGPNNFGGSYPGGTPKPDSGSATFKSDEDLLNGETLKVDVTVDFGGAGYASYHTDGDSTVVVEIVANSTVVASEVLQRTNNFGLITSQTKTATVSYTNTTGQTLEGWYQGGGEDYYYRVKYSSNINSIYSQNFIDAGVTISARRLVFNDDAITIWLTDSATGNYSGSILQAMSVPLVSSTNGPMLEYLREAKEVVFQYPSFVDTNVYDSSLIASASIEGGNYRASTDITTNSIKLTHTTSAPYSASFTAALPSLSNGKNVKFSFTVDFESYWSSYLNSGTVENTPFITASIRNKDTGIVTGSLIYQEQQGEFPRQITQALNYKNDTGAALEDLEFYYQVNVPKAEKGAGNPVITLNNIDISYREVGTPYIKSKVLSSQKLKDVFYLDIDPNIEVASGSLTYLEASSDFYKIGFITGESEVFKFNDYAPVSNNVDSLRRSTLRLKVDNSSYISSGGKYKGFLVPGNFEIISSSIANGLENLDERYFAEVQDSNYFSTGWRNGRYDGSKTDNRVINVASIGNEPVSAFISFEGKIFDSGSSNNTINEIFSGSIFDAELDDIFISTLSTTSVSGSTSTEPVPINFTANNVFISGSGKITFLSLKEEREFKRIVTSKIYRSDTNQIITTDDKGIVINIE